MLIEKLQFIKFSEIEPNHLFLQYRRRQAPLLGISLSDQDKVRCIVFEPEDRVIWEVTPVTNDNVLDLGAAWAFCVEGLTFAERYYAADGHEVGIVLTDLGSFLPARLSPSMGGVWSFGWVQVGGADKGTVAPIERANEIAEGILLKQFSITLFESIGSSEVAHSIDPWSPQI